MEEVPGCPDDLCEVIQPPKFPVTHRLLAGPRYNSTAGMRHRPTQPSGRRKRSFWEEDDDDVDGGFIPKASNGLPKATSTASARSSRTKTKITKHTSRVGSKAAPKARHRQSSPNPLQDYNPDSAPRGDTQSQIVVALTGLDDEDDECMGYDGEGEEGGGF